MYNYILVTAVLSWWLSQIIKFVINLIKFKEFNFERLTGAGGWPSAHSSMVCSACVAVGRVESINSTAFAIVCIFSLITMYDAMGVRRAAGQHAKEINKINQFLLNFDDIKDAMNTKDPIGHISKKVESNYNIMKEYLGHTPFEVLSGAIIGVIFAFLMPMSIGG
ncbi:MAG: divergent PAP2 family protein [Oscillospiraceae bacterium]|nr:divergent PAP2 family protein [Oscillospiraceae bacterium]